MSVSLVLLVKTNPDIANCIWPYVAVPSHTVLPPVYATLLEHAAGLPDVPPLLEREQETYLTSLCRVSVAVKGVAWCILSLFCMVPARRLFCLLGISFPCRSLFGRRAFAVSVIPGKTVRAYLAAVRRPPLAQIGAALLSAIVAFSHRFLMRRIVVRNGTGASTLVPFRLYHHSMQGGDR
jgi:hypothetical protein